MTDLPIQQKLTVVFYADVSSYSRLMRQDEVGTHRRVMGFLDFASESIQTEGGTVLRYAGDAILAEFPSAVAAVQSAIAIQNESVTRNLKLDEGKKIEARIGLNLGEVLEDRGEIFGDGVNLAARLEAAAAPGGVSISASIYELIAKKVGVEFRDAGEQQFKNIDRPVRVYQWHPNTEINTRTAGQLDKAKRGKNRKPTLYLDHGKKLDNKDLTEELYDSVGDVISFNLSNISGIKCVGNKNEADYIADYRIQTSGKKYRITLTLFDCVEDEQYWSERLSGSCEDVFDTVDALGTNVTTAFRFEIYEREGWRLRQIPLEDKSVEDLMSESGPYLYRPYLEDYQRAAVLLDHGIAQSDEPDFMLLSMRALAAIGKAVCGFEVVGDEDGQMAEKMIKKAISLNSRSEFVMHVNSLVQFYWLDDMDGAIRSARKGLEINPALTLCGRIPAMVAVYSGDTPEAFKFINADINSYSRYSGSFWSIENGALAHFVDGNYQESIKWGNRADDIYRDAPRCLLVLIAAYYYQGEKQRALEKKNRLLLAYPEITIAAIRVWPFTDVAHWPRLVKAWTDCGIAED